VDPDNRLPVDFDKRKKMLDAIISGEKENEEAVLQYTSRYRSSGAQKIFLIRKILHFRRNNPELFIRGGYVPVAGTANLMGYIRKLTDQQLLIIVPLPSTNAAASVSGIQGISGTWRNLLTNQSVDLTDTLDPHVLLKDFPVAALFLQK
jgi:(1->4)-alpha-D-glucan 1-alpha-D-glucosylmutase